MSENGTKRLFTAVLRRAVESARIISRNLMIPREFLYETYLSCIDGKVAAYSIKK
jgi:hypothetical protein